jgi:hypothetical protein
MQLMGQIIEPKKERKPQMIQFGTGRQIGRNQAKLIPAAWHNPLY